MMIRRAPPGGGYAPAYGYGSSPAPYGGPAPGYGAPGYAPAGPAPGMGSQILGGLATGAAVGTGVVLAEELAHRAFGEHHSSSSQGLGDSNYVPFQSIPNAAADDMGGTDFGVSDNSSWDDGGSGGGGGDWN
jgi:hypothetical protein